MNGPEIRAQIDINNKRIDEALNKFILTDEIKILMREKQKLIQACPHEFINGVCKYCDVSKEIWELQEGQND